MNIGTKIAPYVTPNKSDARWTEIALAQFRQAASEPNSSFQN